MKIKQKYITAALIVLGIAIFMPANLAGLAAKNQNQIQGKSIHEFTASTASGEEIYDPIAAQKELGRIKESIKKKNAKWEAGETSISRMSLKDQMRMMASDIPQTLPTDIIDNPKESALPATLDWRNRNGNFVTPVKNQGSCGSCWAFAVTANAESVNLIRSNTTYEQNPINLSEQVMVSCSGAGSCSGGQPSTASSFLVSTGLPAESCYAYTATNGDCSAACANWQSNTTTIGNYSRVTSELGAIKNALNNYGPVNVIFNVYKDFYYYKSGIYSYTSGSLAGSHAVLVVGYDDISQSFIVKNSWGTGWGEAGYFRIAYTEMGTVVRFANYVLAYNTTKPIDPDTAAPVASISSPANGSSVSGNVNVDVLASDNVGVSKVDIYLNGMLYASDLSAPYSIIWNTALVSNGSSTISAIAYDSSSNKGYSEIITVIVANFPDTENPRVSIINPVDGLAVSGNVVINASATDNIGIASMSCKVDGKLIRMTTNSSILCNWNSKKAASGSHIIEVSASDEKGNVGKSAITVYTLARTR